MPSLSHDWDARYRAAGRALPDKPAAILTEVLPLLPRGRALDLACGAGRNAIFLASNGWDVTAVDSSSVALELVRTAAQSSGIRVASESVVPSPDRVGVNSARDHGARSGPGTSIRHHASSSAESAVTDYLHLIEADLEKFLPQNRQFDLIVCTNYLQRSLFPSIEHALPYGGVLLYETYTRDQLQFASGPHDPEFLLNLGELRESFPGLTILFYRELSAGKGIASILARKLAD